ncbi:MAG: tetratricopeptide repeat protein [Desulfuromonadaceae bacterium]|nr:tetratricopeptide repeat protein [Desulfuromonadaceae bacterium]
MNKIDHFATNYEKWLLPAIVLITLAVFSPVAWHDFINLDDDVFVYANPNMKSGLTFESIRWAFTTPHEVNWIPLTWISHLLDVTLFGMNAGGHHVVNLLLHTASSALLFLFLRRATGAPWRSATVAFLFALHPLHVESVAWVAERKDVLSAFFGMLTLYAYTCYAEKPDISRYLLTLFLFLLGLLSKPMLVTLPVVLLLLDWWPLGRLHGAAAEAVSASRTTPFRLLMEKIPFFILSLCSSVITYMVQQAEGELAQGYTLLSRAGKAGIAYITYLQKMVWPVKLAVLYPFSKYPPTTTKIILCAVLLVLITAVVILLWKRSPYLLTGWGWYLVTLLPVIGLIQIGQHSVADRYTYIPLIGIFMLVAWGLPQLMQGWKYRNSALSCLAGVCLAFMITLTSLQLSQWKDAYTILTHTIAVTEGNWVAQNNLGLIYLGVGRVNEAVFHFKESIKAKPSYVLAHLNLGVAYMEANELDLALESFKWALQFDPLNPSAHYSRGRIFVAQGDKQRALEEYQALLQVGSNFAPTLLEMIQNPSNATLSP